MAQYDNREISGTVIRQLINQTSSIRSIYGINVPDPVPPTIITPSLVIYEASTKGENQFALLSTQISVLALADTFHGVSLDTTKWTDVSSGGTVAVNGTATLHVPSVGGISSIRTVNTWNNFDVAIRFSFDNAVDQLFPANEIIHARLRARISATNYFDIEHIWDPTRGPAIRINVTSGGVTSLLSESSIRGTSRYLRLVRFNGRIKAYAGTVLLTDFHGWRTDMVNFEITTSCTSSPLNLNTIVLEFTPKVVVSFGDDIAPLATEVAGRIVGTVPPGRLPVLIEVVAYGAATSQSLGYVCKYVSPQQLSLDANKVMVVNDDSTLR